MSKYDKIQVHQPDIGEDEIASVVAALRRGEISGSFGKAIPEFEEKFAAYCGCKYGVSVTSGTTALQLAVSAGGNRPRRRSADERVDQYRNRAGGLSQQCGVGRCRFRARHVEHRSRLDRAADYPALARDHTRPSVRSSGKDGPDHGHRPPAQAARHRGLRGVARRHVEGQDDRRLRRHGVFQLLRQQGDHDRRGRDGRDE